MEIHSFEQAAHPLYTRQSSNSIQPSPRSRDSIVLTKSRLLLSQKPNLSVLLCYEAMQARSVNSGGIPTMHAISLLYQCRTVVVELYSCEPPRVYNIPNPANGDDMAIFG